jgi:hypothetical protein
MCANYPQGFVGKSVDDDRGCFADLKRCVDTIGRRRAFRWDCSLVRGSDRMSYVGSWCVVACLRLQIWGRYRRGMSGYILVQFPEIASAELAAVAAVAQLHDSVSLFDPLHFQLF